MSIVRFNLKNTKLFTFYKIKQKVIYALGSQPPEPTFLIHSLIVSSSQLLTYKVSSLSAATTPRIMKRQCRVGERRRRSALLLRAAGFSTDSSATLRENPTNFPQPQVQLGSE